MDWIGVQGTQFVKAGRPYYLSGTNCYYLPYRPPLRDGVLDKAQAMGLNVIRTWGFQTSMEALDQVVDAARTRNLYLIVTLTNNWKDFGGVPAYLQAAGLTEHDDFFTEATVKQAYLTWVDQVVNRFRDEPAILAWELINEPRSPQGNGAALTGWVDEMSRWIKQRDARHLVAVGDEGFVRHRFGRDWLTDGSTGVDCARLLELDAIDFGTYHLYPDGQWNKSAAWASEQIEEHQDIACRRGKPVLLEEYGWTDKTARNDVYAQWIETLDSVQACGDLFWMLAGPQEDGTPYPDDKYTVYDAAEIPAVTGHAQLKANG